MVSYLNNPTNIVPLSVLFTTSLNEAKGFILPVIREILSIDASWLNTSDDKIHVSVLTGGITNILYLVENQLNSHKVIVRVFGAGTSDFIDRNNENVVFAKLSLLGIGPIFYGLFANGRVEGFVDAKPLNADEMSLPDIYPAIAEAMGKLHCQDISEIGCNNRWLWDEIDLFFRLSEDLKFVDEAKQKALADLNLAKVKVEALWFRDFVANKRASLTSWLSTADSAAESAALLGHQFGYTTALCHNDLLSGNVLMGASPQSPQQASEEESARGSFVQHEQVTLIDYEYASYNFRAYDLANHFNENCGFEFDIVRNFPSSEQRKAFIRSYLQALHPSSVDPIYQGVLGSEEFVAGFEQSVCELTLGSHLMWAVWAVVQSGVSTVDFDYLGYAALRLGGYQHHKTLFNIAS